MNTPAAVIRPAWNADLANMKQVDPSLNLAERSRAATRALALGRSWVADVGGVTVAYALTSFTFFGKPIIERVAIAEPYRRRGVGLALVAQCEASHQDDRMFVTVPSSNAAMSALLAKAGFSGSGVIYNLDEGDPELVFVKLRAPQMTFVPFKREG